MRGLPGKSLYILIALEFLGFGIVRAGVASLALA